MSKHSKSKGGRRSGRFSTMGRGCWVYRFHPVTGIAPSAARTWSRIGRSPYYLSRSQPTPVFQKSSLSRPVSYSCRKSQRHRSRPHRHLALRSVLLLHARDKENGPDFPPPFRPVIICGKHLDLRRKLFDFARCAFICYSSSA